MKKKFVENNNGFTLIEILISLSIFSLLVFAVSTIYVAFNNSQIRTSASQQLLNDSQYAIELMAREIRQSSIVNYLPDCNSLIAPTGKILDDCIILEREDGQSFAFTSFKDTSSSIYTDLYYILLDCNDDYSFCEDWKNSYQSYDALLNVTLNNINLDALDFVISPASDPFVSGGSNQQPKVTIKMTTSYASGNNIENVSHIFQTTVSSRVYRR
jgi:prepilin-type N-terminal cleavage/methylation domain-containing protein